MGQFQGVGVGGAGGPQHTNTSYPPPLYKRGPCKSSIARGACLTSPVGCVCLSVLCLLPPGSGKDEAARTLECAKSPSAEGAAPGAEVEQGKLTAVFLVGDPGAQL